MPTPNPFSQAQVEALALKAGFLPDNAKIAAAIAMCEAPFLIGGVPHADFGAVGDQAIADDKWGFSYGAYQVRSIRLQKGTGGIRDEDRLPDPLFNTKSARQIKLQQGFQAWTTFANGSYKAYMQDVFPPAPGTYVVVSGDTLSGIALKLGKFTWQQLALANGMVSPYTIKIGQVLRLP